MNLFKGKWENLGFVASSKADLILPFSRDLPLNDRLCYEIENATDVKVKEFKIPQNAYRVVLEVYVSFYENDEFWYGNPPNEHITANNPTDLAGNRPFREVVVSLDGEVIVNHTIHFDGRVYVKMQTLNVKLKKSLKRFLLYLYFDYLDQGNETSLSVTNVTLGFNDKKFKDIHAKSPRSSLKNLQKGEGVMVVKDNLVVNGVGSIQQIYNYDGSKFCYSRNISTLNSTILYDEVRNTCNKRAKSHFGYGFSRWWPFPARRTFLASHVIDPNGN
ncbi:hypothetical protein CRYUN_Cryun39dG0046700 [Craigia yunnanensis]